jgi:GDP-L-fucose synthase
MHKILVTGGNGFIGYNLINFLSKKKKYIISTSLYRNRDRNKILKKKIKIHKFDLRNKKNCLKITKNIDTVVMCSANSAGAKVMRNKPMEHFNPNIFMNLNMLEAAYENKVKKFIFISSNAIYPVTNKAVSENDVNNSFFEGYYIAAWMKRISEIACDIYSLRLNTKMNTIIVRPGNLYGPFDKFHPEKSKVIPSLIRKIINNNKKLDVWGDGMDLKDFLYIDDFNLAIEKIIIKVKTHEVFNVASGQSVSIKQIINKILKNLKIKNCKLNFQKDKPSMIPIRRISINKIKKTVKWRPKTNLEDGLKKTINWYKANYGKN